MAHTYNIVILGNPKSGKSALLKRNCTGEFTHGYEPTREMTLYVYNVNVYSAHTNLHTSICLNLYEHPNNQHYYNADAMIMCVSATQNSNRRLNDLVEHIVDFSEVHETIPIVLVSTKTDVVGAHPITNQELSHAHIAVAKHILVSACTCYRMFDPFIAVIRLLMNDDTLFVCEKPA